MLTHVFPKNKGMLLHNHSTNIKKEIDTGTLTLTSVKTVFGFHQFSHQGPFSFSGSNPESCLAFSCPVFLVSSNLRRFLCLSLSSMTLILLKKTTVRLFGLKSLSLCLSNVFL